jgi:hypothetical protein
MSGDDEYIENIENVFIEYNIIFNFQICNNDQL